MTKEKCRFAYLILAHNNPILLSRLVERISTENSDVYIHVDAKSEIEHFSGLNGERLHFTAERVPVFWADFSLVTATLLLIKTALAASRHYDHLILLSGSDYPLRPALEIEDFLYRHRDAEFMNMVAMPSLAMSKPISRLTHYKRRPGMRGLIAAAIRKGLLLLGLVAKTRDYQPIFGVLQPFAGSQWWALTGKACEHILEFARRRPEVMRFFENTNCPDEMVFQTIIGNSPFAANVRRNLTYADWNGGSSPRAIAAHHIEMFRANPSMVMKGADYGPGAALFCRKVTDETVADQLDVLLGEPAQQTPSLRDAAAAPPPQALVESRAREAVA